MKNTPTDMFAPDDFNASMYQRTDELYKIENARTDQNGYFIRPAIVLDEAIVLPHMVTPIFLANGSNLNAILAAQKENETVITLIPVEQDPEREYELEGLDAYENLGLEVAVGTLLELPDKNYSALMQGRNRIHIVDILQDEPFMLVKARLVDDSVQEMDNKLRGLVKTTRSLFEQVVQYDRSIPDEAHFFSMNITDPGWLADMIATAISPHNHQRREIIRKVDVHDRLVYVNHLLAEELDVLHIEDEIQTRVQSEVDRSQREFYLREQVKAIQLELGEGDIWDQEIQEYRRKIDEGDLPEAVKAVVEGELKKLSLSPAMSPETSILRNYMDWLLEVPWTTETEDNLNVRHATKVLNKNHFGLDKQKERLLEYIAVKNLAGEESKQPVLCFLGPPGTGKTSLGKSMAEALGRSFVRISLGGIRDEAEIRGHRRTYIGALPGRIIQTMKRSGSINPVFMLDEIDKMGDDYRGDPSAALFEVLDQEQNSSFSDHYLEIPYDLSKVMFITTANNTDNIPPALLDRMEIIEFPGYLEEEKIKISREFLIPRQMLENGLKNEKVDFTDEAIVRVIRDYTYEAGVRNLEREIARILRKIAKNKSQGKAFPEMIEAGEIEKYCGPQQFFTFEADAKDEIGVATAVAWTESGGEIMPVEVLVMEGKGNLQITGKIGEVMQESAQAALSYVKSRAESFDLDPEDFEKWDIHLHIPEGAIQKDGPSAGITICLALISALTRRKVRMDVGMTGELTLRGRVLQVGGLREKIYAAHRAGLKKIIIPRKNEKDLVEIPKKVRDEIKIQKVNTMDDVLRIALYP
ncbi:MAG: ATP-dependent Lon protease [Chloroflexota bacterium]|nr:ATP-dependent Lon protease [Chloroflexota bacterium]